jgi:hypothetical protein
VIAVDTNILVYAHRRDSDYHEAARRSILELAGGLQPWAIPWSCIHEFLGVVTHGRIFDPPSTLGEAVAQVEAWLEAPNLVTISESSEYWPVLKATLLAGKTTGPRVHDARIAALCQQHGVRELWSADRDFSRFPDLPVVNPLLR